jgi:hypothetical protein
MQRANHVTPRVNMSRATIYRVLTKDSDIFHQEKAELFQEGLKATSYQQIDDTGARVNGVNHYTQILCNPYYAAYFTVPNKIRKPFRYATSTFRG